MLTASLVGRRIWIKALAEVIPKVGCSGAVQLVRRLQKMLVHGDDYAVLRLASLLVPALGETGKNGNGHGPPRQTNFILDPGAVSEMAKAAAARGEPPPAITLNGETYEAVLPEDIGGAAQPTPRSSARDQHGVIVINGQELEAVDDV